MKYLSISIIAIFLSMSAIAQTSEKEDQISEQSKTNAKWVNSLYEHGIRSEEDSLFVSAEVQNIMANADLKAFMFPDTYSWEAALYLLEHMELKKAFWFLINLYPEDKELVMKTVLSYDKVFQMDKVLISTFYTYAMIDPAVCEIINGKPQIKRPDLAESKLNTVNEMVQYVNHYRAIAENQ